MAGVLEARSEGQELERLKPGGNGFQKSSPPSLTILVRATHLNVGSLYVKGYSTQIRSDDSINWREKMKMAIAFFEAPGNLHRCDLL